MGHSRRSDKNSELMLVKLPSIDDAWENTHEGGLAFYFCVTVENHDNDRCICIPGESFKWEQPDVCFNFGYQKPIYLDCGMLIGSTGQSLFNDFTGEYFRPKYRDLTKEGKNLYNMLKKLYGKVDIVTKLDT